MTIEAAGAKKDVKSDAVLVAAGRAPNIEDIGLKELGVKLTERGFVQIDKTMATSVANVYAIGDVAGPPMLAHKGEREGSRREARGPSNACARYPTTGATIVSLGASVGLTERSQTRRSIQSRQFPFSATDGAHWERRSIVKKFGANYVEILARTVGAHATE